MDIDALQRRREARRRAVARRRRLSFAAVALLVLAIAAVLLVSRSGGASSHAGHGKLAAHAPKHAHGRHGANSASAAPAAPATTTGAPGSESVPILMYHVIAPPPAGAPFPGLYVPASEFAAQMRALRDAGWHAVTLDQVEAYWRRGVPLPAGKPIVLSFDNGYHSQFAEALPILRRLGWVGDENIQLTGLPPSQGGLSEREIRGLIAAGWELDTQGISHADLITLNATQLREQVSNARNVIRRRYGVPVNWFCYPSGHYDATVIAAVETAGFTGSTTVVPGWAHPGENRYRLHRLRVLGGTSPSTLLSQIAATRQNPPAPTSYTGA
jgi:peptidoglycan/xylan/chitin deacetylase (PgdA/CDA1 family)